MKKGGICKGKHYQVEELYTDEQLPVLHKNGFHFAHCNDWDTIKQWYRYNPENEVYLVQIGGGAAVVESEKILATNKLYVLQKIGTLGKGFS